MTSVMDPYTYILVNRKPVNHRNDDEWFQWFMNIDNRRVGWTEVRAVIVSTVFCGLDLLQTGKMFETTIMGGKHDGEMWTTATWEEAEAQHARIVEQVHLHP